MSHDYQEGGGAWAFKFLFQPCKLLRLLLRRQREIATAA
jgi:hypothetical protein